MQNPLGEPHASAPHIVTGLAPNVAFARACAHLMTRPAFARAPFGHVARCLAGQVRRGHYAFAMRGKSLVGFVGWALTTEPVAEAWLRGERAFSGAEADAGDCVVLNFWQAEDAAVMRGLASWLAARLPEARRLYGRRAYPDGRTRPVRLDLERRARARAKPLIQ